LLNVVDHAPRFPYASTNIASIKTIWADLGYLRVFLGWLTDRGITSFTDVTINDLDRYHRDIVDRTDSATWKRKAFLAVQRLQLYRDYLPAHCRLPDETLWGGASAAELAGQPDQRRMGNRTPRIHPDIMRPLLSAALLVIDTIAADVLPTAQQLNAMRSLALTIAPEAILRGSTAWDLRRAHLDQFLGALAAASGSLPAHRNGDDLTVDLRALALGAILPLQMLEGDLAAVALRDSGLPIQEDLLRVTHFSSIGQRSWRDRPIETIELPSAMRHITTACFLVIAFLSGIRTGERSTCNAAASPTTRRSA
jgi:hypothetical protein